MNLPSSWTERLPFLGVIEQDWRPVSRFAWMLAFGFYALFLFQASRGTGIVPYFDLVFVPIHEGGHLLFRFFGEFLAIAGGTLLQLGVALILAFYFAFHRQIQGTAFCTFFFFEQLLPVSTYMADARAQQLPLLTVGDSDDVIHDWEYLFSKFGVLDHDRQIAHGIRMIGWIGMVATVIWMVWRSLKAEKAPGSPQ